MAWPYAPVRSREGATRGADDELREERVGAATRGEDF
jgi:hypothetical protein